MPGGLETGKKRERLGLNLSASDARSVQAVSSQLSSRPPGSAHPARSEGPVGPHRLLGGVLCWAGLGREGGGPGFDPKAAGVIFED